MKPLIWLAEDEAGIADTLVYTLETDGFAVEWFERGLPLLERLAAERPALCILDVGLPDINGFELCRRLRERTDVPLMFLTARSEEMDRIIGLEIGADDYVASRFAARGQRPGAHHSASLHQGPDAGRRAGARWF